MLQQRGRMVAFWVVAGNVIATAVAFVGAYYGAGVLLREYVSDFNPVLPVSDYAWMLLLAIPAWVFVLFSFGQYELDRLQQQRSLALGVLRPALIVGLVLFAAVFMVQEKYFARRVVYSFLGLNFVLLVATRYAVLLLAARLARQTKIRRNLLIVGSPDKAHAFVEAMVQDRWGLRVVGFVSDGVQNDVGDVHRLGALSDLTHLLDEAVVDDVIIAEPEGGLTRINEVIRQCEEVGVRVHIQASCFDALLSRPHFEDFRGVRFLTFSAGPYDPVRLAIKRAMDILVAAFLAAATSWFMVLVAVGIRLSSRGPILYRQVRSGLNGREFTMYKFRSMVATADAQLDDVLALNIMSGPVFKAPDDPRITNLGRMLRRYSIDELPQLWNVLKGDMSLVGPRPALPAEVRKYKRWQRRRLSMRPGITGLWQVRGRNRVDFDEWMRLDLEYIDHWSLWSDIKILLRTFPEVLHGTGI